jgi:glycosyltransferase involved in cell wall biosynthesis
MSGDSLCLAVIVPFQDEAAFLPLFLKSIEEQTRPPDILVLVDDGSTDTSGDLVESFAKRASYARVLHRPIRPPVADRLAGAPELAAFQWAASTLPEGWDVVAKLDPDVQLSPQAFDVLLQEFRNCASLGMAGFALVEARPDGSSGPMGHIQMPPDHVPGPTKFYRRGCFEDISPIPLILGWDTADEYDARRHGWQTRNVVTPGGACIHLRPMGAHAGALRSFKRWGACAYGYGAHPLHVILYAGQLAFCRPPRLVGGLFFMAGWLTAVARRPPRADADIRAFVRREQLARIGRRVSALARTRHRSRK